MQQTVNSHENSQQQQKQYKKIAKVSAPGKVILCGEHAVVYGQDALALAIQLRCKSTIYKANHSQNPFIHNTQPCSLNIPNKQQQLTTQCLHQSSQSLQTNKNKNYLLIKWRGTVNCDITQQNLSIFEQSFQFNQYFQKCTHKKQKYKEQNKQKLNEQQNKQNKQQQISEIQGYKVMYKVCIFMREANINIQQLLHNRNVINEYQVQISSQIPIGKCLGSSAAFNTVLVATMFIIIKDLHLLNPHQQDILKQPNSINLHEVNRISKILQKVEHGTPSGIDNYVSTFGGLVLYNNSKVPPFASITDPIIIQKLTTDIQLRLIDSQIQKNTKKAVGIVRQNCETDEKYKNMIKIIGTYAKKVLDLLRNQDQNVRNYWPTELFSIMSQNHKLLCQLGVSIPQIQQIVTENTIKGKRSAKITGAGMGGYVLIAQKVTKSSQINKQQIFLNKQSSQKHTVTKEVITKMSSMGLCIQCI